MGSISPYNLDPAQYKFPSPLNGWEKHTPLSESKTQDGKSYDSPDNSVLSDAYEHFVAPISNGGRHDSQLPGFDVHVYFNPVITPWAPDADGLANRPPARQISIPELRTYPLHTDPQGPHAPGMFEVALFTPHQFGAFVSWMVVHRGPLSALVHPNTDEELRDHLHMTAWLGPEVPLDMERFRLRPMCETMDRRAGTVTKIVDTGDAGKTVKEVRRIE
ncbi:unnamed protein product [Penicillium salamii]|nr:unnamed protein product [Penicillium salamii]CAG8245479.1 unnamed protein product [Penicillium salamii]CAG8401314.1 unnamed protein product [Penicillium salamii]CAG8403789.1 unnamed protein product [Penicillium salamii]